MTTCNVEWCDREVTVRGFCFRCYRRLLKSGKIKATRKNKSYTPFQGNVVSDRTKEVVARLMQGERMARIAKDCGLSRQRVYHLKRMWIDHMNYQTHEPLPPVHIQGIEEIKKTLVAS